MEPCSHISCDLGLFNSYFGWTITRTNSQTPLSALPLKTWTPGLKAALMVGQWVTLRQSSSIPVQRLLSVTLQEAVLLWVVRTTSPHFLPVFASLWRSICELLWAWCRGQPGLGICDCIWLDVYWVHLNTGACHSMTQRLQTQSRDRCTVYQLGEFLLTGISHFWGLWYLLLISLILQISESLLHWLLWNMGSLGLFHIFWKCHGLWHILFSSYFCCF